ncbi:MAG: hypothetical protein K2L22_05745 [Muribaculaceae bacterium]|nr:hypothetical protein [Muribaculaceae bacterium]
MRLKLLNIIKGICVGILSMTCLSATAGIAVLDICERNNEVESLGDNSRQVYSASYLCDIAGYDYIVTTDIKEAMTQDVILLANVMTNTSFTRDELLSISEWIKGGGTLVTPAIRYVPTSCADIISEIFGIDANGKFNKSNENTIIKWNEEYYGDRELEYIDEDHERETSIGRVKSFSFTPATCDVLASYSNGDAAVARNLYGDGAAYLAGVSWREVVQRNQLNKDQNSSRQYNNGFEPSSDVWALFLRSIHAKATGLSVWKFTVPAGYLQLLIPTHDCDSRTAYDEMHYMSEYEKSLGMSGHYFLTTHYYSDKINFGHSYLSDFYNSETIPKAAKLIEDGHTVGSHSVCHFPDFNKTRNTDVVTKEEYAHRATCEDGVSTGVSTWAEIVMSKQILEEDLGNNVRSFRSGHLCVNPDFHAMLEEGKYSFQSCYTGGDLLSEFPFFGRYNNNWSDDLSNVLTMQLHISDVYNNKDGEPLNNDTWETHRAPDEWESAMQKLRGNYASAILLIHPNREWKMILQKRLVDRLDPSEVGMYNFEDYGDFWISRLKNRYSYVYNEEDRQLTIYTEDIADAKKNLLTYAVEITDKPVNNVVVSNYDATEAYNANLKKLSDTRYLATPDYDNPLGAYVGQLKFDDKGEYTALYDVNGNLISTDPSDTDTLSNLPKGIYILKGLNYSKKIRI